MKFTLTMLIIFAAGIGALEWGQQHMDVLISQIGLSVVLLTFACLMFDLVLFVRRANRHQIVEKSDEPAKI